MLTEVDIDYNALAKSIIVQAIEDATTWNTRGKGNGGATWDEVKEAREFLCATSGEWQESREIWCGLAGYCPDKLGRIMRVAISKGFVVRRSDFEASVLPRSGD